MARRRYQKGSLVPKTGIPRNGLWVGRWREDVIQVDGTITRPYKWEVLGTIRDYPTRRLALRALEARLSTVNNPTYRARPTATLAANAAQFTPSQSGSEIQQYHYSLTLFQLTVDKLGKLVNAEAGGCCLAHAALPNRRNGIAVCPFIADCVLVQKMHQVPDLLFRTIG